MWRLLTFLFGALLLATSIALFAAYSERGLLSFDNAESVAAIASSIVAAVSLIFIAYQIDYQSKLTRANNSQSLVNISSGIVASIIQDPKLMELWMNGGESYESLPDIDRYRYNHLLCLWLSLYENIIYQKECGLLDDGVYAAWMSDMDAFLGGRCVAKVWPTWRGSYSASFVRYMDAKLTAIVQRPPAPAPRPPDEPQSGGRGEQ